MAELTGIAKRIDAWYECGCPECKELIAAVERLAAEHPEIEPDRRAPVQPRGTIAWSEHEEAWTEYSRRYSGQSAKQIAERGGFGMSELRMFLGREPSTLEGSADRA